MLTQQEILAALVELGDTPGEVATALHERRCTGQVGAPGDCPVARYLDWLGVDSPSVGEAAVDVPAPGGRRIEFPLPAPVRGFVQAFDGGCYRHLAEDSTHG